MKGIHIACIVAALLTLIAISPALFAIKYLSVAFESAQNCEVRK